MMKSRSLLKIFFLSALAVAVLMATLGGSASLFVLLLFAAPPLKAVTFILPGLLFGIFLAIGTLVVLVRSIQAERRNNPGLITSPLHLGLIVLSVALGVYLVVDYPYYLYKSWEVRYPPSGWTTYADDSFTIRLPDTWRADTDFEDNPGPGGNIGRGGVFLKSWPKCFTPLVCPILLNSMAIRVQISSNSDKGIVDWLDSQKDIESWEKGKINGKTVVWAKSVVQSQSRPATNVIFLKGTRVARLEWLSEDPQFRPLFDAIAGSFEFES